MFGNYVFSCLHYVKDIKFESNSQRMRLTITQTTSCLHYVKDIKFESNSQRSLTMFAISASCLHYVKDIKFESNSQLSSFISLYCFAVCIMSKI